MNDELKWGQLQPGNDLDPRRERRSEKWVHKCDGCGQMFWSDEAANLHYIGDCLVRLANTFANVMAERVREAVEG